MYCIYALVDPRDHTTFYIGMTDDIYARFAQHLRCDGSNLRKDARIRELKAVNKMLLMPTLEEIETLDQARKRESYWIRHYYDLGTSLTNQVIPVYQENIVIVEVPHAPVKPPSPSLRAGMTPDEQREYLLYLLHKGIPHARIISKVKDYIHPKYASCILNEFVPQDPFDPQPVHVSITRRQKSQREIPERLRMTILNLYREGRERKDIQKELRINGDAYWMLKAVCDEYDRQMEVM